MNIYSIVILSALIIEFLTQLVADLLNLRTLNSNLPNEFVNVFNEASYKKSQMYTKAKLKFNLLESAFNLLIIIVFWFIHGFNYVDKIVRSFGYGSVLTALMYIGILVLIKVILSIPFSAYLTFVIEEKFGFNKTSLKVFITDLIKEIFLIILMGGPLIIVIMLLFENTGTFAWFYCWMIASLFVLFVQFVAPTWIMPLFNKFTPLEQVELKKAILSYANSVSYSVKDIYVMDGSKRSSKSNAFFAGFGKNKRIALFDTLLEKHTVSEIVAILAHEIGHYKKKHILLSIILSIFHLGIMFYIMQFFISEKGLFDAFYMEHMSVYAGLLFFSLLFSPIDFLLSFGLNAISRKNEYEADRFAVETYGDSMSMINALKKLSLNNLSHLTPHPFYVFLNYSHPPVLQRIQQINKLTK